jgi:DNA recombination protein RmuC
MRMDIVILALLIVVAVIAAFAVFSILKLRGRAGEAEGLRGELAHLTETFAAGQRDMEERLKAEQRALTERLHEREATLNKTLAEGLQTTTKKTLESINKVEVRLAVIDKAQANIADLSGQVVNLQNILSNKQARGAFGEIHALHAARDEVAKKSAERAFRDAMQTHIKDISERYILAGETADAALMFLPSEAVYAELHANFPAVVEASYRARVFIVSPTTLWATLNTVRAILKDVRMKEQAGLIQKEVQTLLADVVRLDDRVGKLQRHFDQAGDDMRQIRISTDKVGKRAERIESVQLEDEADSDGGDSDNVIDPPLSSTGED